jgi:hypothetical protein
VKLSDSFPFERRLKVQALAMKMRVGQRSIRLTTGVNCT